MNWVLNIIISWLFWTAAMITTLMLHQAAGYLFYVPWLAFLIAGGITAGRPR
jgi:hypothetical protein